MINYSDLYEIFDYFGYIFHYGFKNRYSYEYMQNRISNSHIIKNLEHKSDCFFLINSKLNDSIKDIYELFNNEVANDIHPDNLSFWVAEAYLRISFKYRKSLSFIFLYIPIEEMILLFNPYHEMDWSNLYNLFSEKVSNGSLLRLILDSHHLSINKLSQLTGISKNTLTTYLNDKRLYEAKFEYIYKISNSLDIDIDIFALKINNLVKEEIKIDNDNHQLFSVLALYILSYYSSEIANRDYIYNNQKDIYIDKDNYLKIFISKDNHDSNNFNFAADNFIKDYSLKLSSDEKKKTIVVIYELKDISTSIDPYKKWIEYGFDKIFIINSNNVICIKDSYWQSRLNQDTREKLLTRLL